MCDDEDCIKVSNEDWHNISQDDVLSVSIIEGLPPVKKFLVVNTSGGVVVTHQMMILVCGYEKVGIIS